MKRWLASLTGGGKQAEAPSAEQRTRELRDEYAAAVLALLPDARIMALDDASFEANLPDGSRIVTHVDNLSRAVAADPARRTEIVAQFARDARYALNPEAPSLDNLVSVVRTDRWLVGLLGEVSGRVLHRPLAGDLVEVLAQNTPDTFNYSRGDAYLALASENELWAAGRRNIKPLIGRVQSEPLGGSLEALSAPDSGLASSLILLEFLWTEPRCALAAGYELFMADPRDEDAVAVLQRQIDRGREFGEPNVSTTLITHDGQALVAL